MSEKIALLIANLGSPAAPTEKAVRDYLEEFLGDPLVVGLPPWLWLPFLKMVVLNIRPKKTAALYQKIWSELGSPLVANSKKVKSLLDRKLDIKNVTPFLAMRYPEKELRQIIEKIGAEDFQKILLFPQFPQYSRTTTGSMIKKTASMAAEFPRIRLQVINDFHSHPAYIGALASTVRTHWLKQGKGSRLLLSFHGLPQKMIDDGDPYLEQCLKTAELLGKELEMDKPDLQIGFQSRFGLNRWIGPAVKELVMEWGQQKLSSLDVLCPGFTCDCLETLEEIAVTEKNRFQQAGGGEYRYIPCLNQDPAWVDAMRTIAKEAMATDGENRVVEELLKDG